MNIDFWYRLVQFICNKNQQGYITPANFNDIINSAQFSYLDYLFGLVQQYQPGKPIAKVEIGLSQTIRQILSAFIDKPSIITIDVNGLSPYPTDFQRVDAMYTVDMKRIKYVQQESLASYLCSRIDPVVSKPIYLIESDGFQFYPNTTFNNVALSSAKLSYVKTPTTIVWAFNPDANGRPIYDSVNSVDPLWYDLDMEDVVARALKLVGVNLQSAAIGQYATELKQIGQ